jgi:hypothetical protein
MSTIAVITVAATTRAPQLALASWVLRLGPPPLGQVTTGQDTDTMDRDMDIMGRDTAITATRIRIAAAITIHIKDTGLRPDLRRGREDHATAIRRACAGGWSEFCLSSRRIGKIRRV